LPADTVYMAKGMLLLGLAEKMFTRLFKTGVLKRAV
jgi:hypothetical protein